MYVDRKSKMENLNTTQSTLLYFTYESIKVVLIQQVKVFRQCLKNFLDILTCLSTRLNIVCKLLIASKSQSFFMGHFARLLHI